MGQGFLHLMSSQQVPRVLSRFLPIGRTEQIALADCPGRVVAAAVLAPEALPPFDRALMDGYAVRAAEVASARETSPVFLEVVGAVPMGVRAEPQVGPGQAVAVPTGGMLPEGADAMVMVEHTRELPDGRIEVSKASAPGQHILHRGEDLAKGDALLPVGRRVATLDLGALAASGVTELAVYARPRVAILSTGDELVSPDEIPRQGQVRDTNASTLAAQVRASGGLPSFAGRVVDDYQALREATRRACEQADLLLLTGGSSVGARDHTAQVLRDLAEADLLIEGIALSPGKPTLLADLAGVPAFGMPGHPVSSFVVFHTVVAPLVRRLGGLIDPQRPRVVRGRLTANLPGSPGRETWQRVRLVEEPDGALCVKPVPGTSAVYTSLLASDGLLRIGADQEDWAKGEEVEVEMLR